MKVVTVEEMRAIERASDAQGHTYAKMMEEAGLGVAEAIRQRWEVAGQTLLVLVGPGNNGGDGLVAARHLADAGADVRCYLTRPRPADDANLQAVRERQVPTVLAGEDEGGKVLRRWVREAGIIVDALLGTGARPPLRGTIAGVVEVVRQELDARRRTARARRLTAPAHPAPLPAGPAIVAVDGPSGMDYDTGEMDPNALPAHLTVTFAYPKRGHFLFPAAGALGELVVADIGTDPALAEGVGLEVATGPMIADLLPPRPAGAHKGSFGRALIVAGSVNYVGAACLAGGAATRVGAGLVTMALPQPIQPAVAAHLTETTYILLPHDLGVISPEAIPVLADWIGNYRALLVGSGLTREKPTVTFVRRLLGVEPAPKRGSIGFRAGEKAEKGGSAGPPFPLPPLVIDADGLNALVDVEGWWERLPRPAILTPHPGEMARLMGVKTAEVQADRLGVAARMAGTWGVVLVLKGAHTVIADPNGRLVLLPFANPALATAGTGDVLAGAIVGLLAQGLEPFAAALAGAYLHGLAGELVRQEIGPAGGVAGDLLPRLPQALATLREA